MNDVVEQFLARRASLPLPKTAKTRSGVEFAPNELRWNFRDGTTAVSVNFELIPEICAPLVPGLKKTLLWYFENRAPHTSETGFHNFLRFSRFLADGYQDAVDRITPEHVLAFKMSADDMDPWLGRLRPFIYKWCELGAPGVGKELVDMLRRLKLRQPDAGVAVATLDPKKGPLTDLEFEAVQTALSDAYARGELETENLLLCYLLMSLGVRPVQLASMKCCDLLAPERADGDYLLRVPRAKQQGRLGRDEFKLRRLIRQLGEPLAAHVEGIRAEFTVLLENTREAPLFPQRKKLRAANGPGFEHHARAGSLAIRVAMLFASLEVRSERLEEPMPISAIRFRRTFATRAAEEGWPLLVLAELMDHTDTRHVEIYAGLTSRIRAAFSRKIAMEMAPLAIAFAGKLIRSEKEAKRPGPASRIIDLRVDRNGASMGSCGSYAHCGFARPITCYGGCQDFEPWLDGPHEAAFDYMLERREKLMVTTDARIAAINDRAILGCAQVILRCREILGAGKHE